MRKEEKPRYRIFFSNGYAYLYDTKRLIGMTDNQASAFSWGMSNYDYRFLI